MHYTLEGLKKINERYSGFHFVDMSDLETVNAICELIEKSRQGEPVPMDGDRIHCYHPENGLITTGGYLEKREERPSVCVYPYVPFITMHKERLGTDASGGPWHGFSSEQAEYVGKAYAPFKVWGHFGPCANGAVYFEAEVFCWKITDPHFYKHDFMW